MMAAHLLPIVWRYGRLARGILPQNSPFISPFIMIRASAKLVRVNHTNKSQRDTQTQTSIRCETRTQQPIYKWFTLEKETLMLCIILSFYVFLYELKSDRINLSVLALSPVSILFAYDFKIWICTFHRPLNTVSFFFYSLSLSLYSSIWFNHIVAATNLKFSFSFFKYYFNTKWAWSISTMRWVTCVSVYMRRIWKSTLT